MSSSGITPINSGPLTIRTYLDSSADNTYLLGQYDYPIPQNRVLITSTSGLLGPSDNIYLSSINISTINGLPYLPGGVVDAVVPGSNITVNSTNIAYPIVNLNSTILVSTLTTSTISSLTILDRTGQRGMTSQVLTAGSGGQVLWSTFTVAAAGGVVDAVVPGSNITVNSTNIAYPIVHLNSTIIVSTLTTSTISSLTILDRTGQRGTTSQILTAGSGGQVLWSTFTVATGGGVVDAVVPGNNITVNSTNIAYPIVNLNSTIIVSSLTASTIRTTTFQDRNSSVGTNGQFLLTTGSTGVIWSTVQSGTVLPGGAFKSDYLSWNGSAWVASVLNNVYLGKDAGSATFGNSVALGYQAGQTSQSQNTIAIGVNAGQTSQTQDGIAIGRLAGQTTQGQSAIAIGAWAGNFNQLTDAISIGEEAGRTSQNTAAIAIGNLAGNYQQGENSIAIGKYAGFGSNGNPGGSGIYVQKANSIILNASGTFETWTLLPSAFYVRPIRNDATSATNYLLQYSTGTSEITYNTAKTFVINHPNDSERYLVHACLEGPEDGIYYRGKAEITDNNSTIITLPTYVNALGADFTVQITPIYNGTLNQYAASEVENGRFTVYGQNGKFCWLVNGKRSTFNVEPLKSSAQLMGQGPYKWLQYI
jgi:hypothetical protein